MQNVPSLMLEVARAAEAGVYCMGSLATLGVSSEDVRSLQRIGMPVMVHDGNLLITRPPVYGYNRAGGRVELIARYDNTWVDKSGRVYATRDVILDRELPK